MFYNTSISTYFWVLTNRKRPERRGKVLLLDARGEFEKMRKSLGQKRKFISDDAIAEVTRLYMEAADIDLDDPRVKVLHNEAFGFQRVTVEQPLRRRWVISAEAVAAVGRDEGMGQGRADLRSRRTIFASILGGEFADEKECLKAVQTAASVGTAAGREGTRQGRGSRGPRMRRSSPTAGATRCRTRTSATPRTCLWAKTRRST